MIMETKIDNSDINESIELFYSFIYSNRNIKEKNLNFKIGEGKINKRAEIDFNLRDRFYHSQKAVFELITNDVSTDCFPSKSDLESYFQSKSMPGPKTNWDCCPLLKSANKSFDFYCPEPKVIRHILFGLSVYAPGINNVTYQDLKAVDPN